MYRPSKSFTGRENFTSLRLRARRWRRPLPFSANPWDKLASYKALLSNDIQAQLGQLELLAKEATLDGARIEGTLKLLHSSFDELTTRAQSFLRAAAICRASSRALSASAAFSAERSTIACVGP
jgi:hypothetical protein